MKFQASMRHVPSLVLLAAVAATCPAAAQERVAEPPPKLRDAKSADVPASAAAQEGASESPSTSRDAKMVETKRRTVDWKMEAIRNDLRIPAKPREESESPASTCKENCEQKVPAAASPTAAVPLTQETPAQKPEILPGAEADLSANEDAASRRRLGQALGAGGAVVVLVGTYLVVATIAARPDTYGEFATGRSAFFAAGLAGVGVGAGLMVGGFSLASANRPASIAMDRPAVPAFVERRALGEIGVSLTGKF